MIVCAGAVVHYQPFHSGLATCKVGSEASLGCLENDVARGQKFHAVMAMRPHAASSGF